jgi:hypothetical protein
MMNTWLAQRAGEEAGSFSAQARAWAEANGIVRGDGSGAKLYKSFGTREQITVFLYRLYQLLKQEQG